MKQHNRTYVLQVGRSWFGECGPGPLSATQTLMAPMAPGSLAKGGMLSTELCGKCLLQVRSAEDHDKHNKYSSDLLFKGKVII